jgi:hypothetical protein
VWRPTIEVYFAAGSGKPAIHPQHGIVILDGFIVTVAEGEVRPTSMIFINTKLHNYKFAKSINSHEDGSTATTR